MKIYDLSQPLNEQFPFWPYYPPFEVKYIKRKAEHGVNAQYIMTSNHMGTHLDAPRHFVSNGKTIDEIPIEWCTLQRFSLHASIGILRNRCAREIYTRPTLITTASSEELL